LINCSLIYLKVVKAFRSFRRLSIKLYLPELLTDRTITSHTIHSKRLS